MLVGDHVERVAFGGQPQDGVDEVRAVPAVEPGGAQDPGPVGQLGAHGPLAGGLGPAVGAAGRDRGVLGVGLGRVAGEDVVGGDLQQPRPGRRAGAGQGRGADGVDGERRRLVGLGAVDVGEGRAVDDDVDVGDRRGNLIGVGDVELRQVEAATCRRGRRERAPAAGRCRACRGRR